MRRGHADCDWTLAPSHLPHSSLSPLWHASGLPLAMHCKLTPCNPHDTLLVYKLLTTLSKLQTIANLCAFCMIFSYSWPSSSSTSSACCFSCFFLLFFRCFFFLGPLHFWLVLFALAILRFNAPHYDGLSIGSTLIVQTVGVAYRIMCVYSWWTCALFAKQGSSIYYVKN